MILACNLHNFAAQDAVIFLLHPSRPANHSNQPSCDQVSDTFFLEINHFLLEKLRTFTGMCLSVLRSEVPFSDLSTFLF
jgi:hypothetical protein